MVATVGLFGFISSAGFGLLNRNNTLSWEAKYGCLKLGNLRSGEFEVNDQEHEAENNA